MGMIACLDSNIVIWGIKQEAEKGQEAMIPRAMALLDLLDDQNAKVMIPAIVIAEILVKVPPEKHIELLGLLQKRFMIAPFDTRCAPKYADIWMTKRNFGREDPSFNRTHMKFDMMIVAIAAAYGVDTLYSHDRGVHNFAEGVVVVSEMPNPATQLALPNIEPEQI